MKRAVEPRVARLRLPAWADRIFEGNAMDWRPPMRFTYVRTGLEYVPADQRAALVGHLLRELVAPGGRLIVGPVAEADLTCVLHECERARLCSDLHISFAMLNALANTRDVPDP